jgi:DtxR family manganese transport transcriptional regulator
MFDSTPFADGHRRTRSDHAMETGEDYVRAIQKLETLQGKCRIVDLAREFGVSHVTVTKTISRLKRLSLVTSQKYGPVSLTSRGRTLAEKSQMQHRVVYEFLLAIGVNEQAAKTDAEGIEHHVSRNTLECFERLRQLLGAHAAAEATSQRSPTMDIRGKSAPTKATHNRAA